MASRVRVISAGARELLNSSEVRAELLRRAERVLNAATADAVNYQVTGNYYRSIGIEQATTDRAVVRVRATAPHAHLVEAKHGTLARALDAAGGA